MVKKQILKIAAIGLLFMSTAGFLFFQQSTLVQEEKQLIIGTWVVDDDANYKIKFESNGTCYKYYTGEPTQEFTYSINSEFAPNGSEHTFLKLIAVSSDVYDPGEVVEYAINSLGDDKMTLETIHPKVGYTHFTKQ